MSDVITVGFLQNQWFQQPEKARNLFATRFKGDRERFIRMFLFHNCRTGKRLEKIFEERVDEIIWENVNPNIVGKSAGILEADFHHIDSVLQKHTPAIVIAFGGVATRALQHVFNTEAEMNGRPPEWSLILGPHPMAKIPHLAEKLMTMRVLFEEAYAILQ